MEQKARHSIWSRASLYIFYGLLAYMPLHIFLSTWIGTSLDMLPAAKIAKDVVLVIGFLFALAVSVRKPWFKLIIKSKLVWVILLYALWTVGLAVVKPTDQDAEILGVVYNLRFSLFFLYGILLVKLFPPNEVRRRAVRIVMAVGAIVVTFGILQYLVLPDDSLARFGYARENGVLPAFFIDDKPDLERVMSTIRDPNSLGSYLVIIGPLAAAGLFIYKRAQDKWPPRLLLVGTAACVWFTFSRSAWIGFAAALLAFFLLTDSSAKVELYKKRLLLVPMFVVGVSVVMSSFFFFRDTYFIQNLVLHADESTVLEDPNELRLRFWSESLEAIAQEPLGTGPGTAGLASIRNDIQGTELNENYYLQIASETGLIGLILFLTILVAVSRRLYDMRYDSYVAIALLAAFIGLAITNFLVHIWSNEAVAYTWWGLAGLTIASTRR